MSTDRTQEPFGRLVRRRPSEGAEPATSELGGTAAAKEQKQLPSQVLSRAEARAGMRSVGWPATSAGRQVGRQKGAKTREPQMRKTDTATDEPYYISCLEKVLK